MQNSNFRNLSLLGQSTLESLNTCKTFLLKADNFKPPNKILIQEEITYNALTPIKNSYYRFLDSKEINQTNSYENNESQEKQKKINIEQNNTVKKKNYEDFNINGNSIFDTINKNNKQIKKKQKNNNNEELINYPAVVNNQKNEDNKKNNYKIQENEKDKNFILNVSSNIFKSQPPQNCDFKESNPNKFNKNEHANDLFENIETKIIEEKINNTIDYQPRNTKNDNFINQNEEKNNNNFNNDSENFCIKESETKILESKISEIIQNEKIEESENKHKPKSTECEIENIKINELEEKVKNEKIEAENIKIDKNNEYEEIQKINNFDNYLKEKNNNIEIQKNNFYLKKNFENKHTEILKKSASYEEKKDEELDLNKDFEDLKRKLIFDEFSQKNQIEKLEKNEKSNNVVSFEHLEAFDKEDSENIDLYSIAKHDNCNEDIKNENFQIENEEKKNNFENSKKIIQEIIPPKADFLTQSDFNKKPEIKNDLKKNYEKNKNKNIYFFSKMNINTKSTKKSESLHLKQKNEPKFIENLEKKNNIISKNIESVNKEKIGIDQEIQQIDNDLKNLTIKKLIKQNNESKKLPYYLLNKNYRINDNNISITEKTENDEKDINTEKNQLIKKISNNFTQNQIIHERHKKNMQWLDDRKLNIIEAKVNKI